MSSLPPIPGMMPAPLPPPQQFQQPQQPQPQQQFQQPQQFQQQQQFQQPQQPQQFQRQEAASFYNPADVHAAVGQHPDPNSFSYAGLPGVPAQAQQPQQPQEHSAFNGLPGIPEPAAPAVPGYTPPAPAASSGSAQTVKELSKAIEGGLHDHELDTLAVDPRKGVQQAVLARRGVLAGGAPASGNQAAPSQHQSSAWSGKASTVEVTIRVLTVKLGQLSEVLEPFIVVEA